jgi:release factor glutamine methyltransferase
LTETELLFTHVLDCERVDLYLRPERKLEAGQYARIGDALRRRMSGEPLEYILGKSWFMGHEFIVDANVLIPRPETELLVEAAIRYAREANIRTVADIGTGSGNIAVSIACALPTVRLVALDISEAALAVARRNARDNVVNGRISFLSSDVLEAAGPDTFGMIVSNPPYVASREIDGLQPEVRREPRGALDGGKDGLDFYRRIAAEAPRCLGQRGMLLLEIGFGQCERVQKILEVKGFRVREIIKDYAGIERVIAAQKG